MLKSWLQGKERWVEIRAGWWLNRFWCFVAFHDAVQSANGDHRTEKNDYNYLKNQKKF